MDKEGTEFETINNIRRVEDEQFADINLSNHRAINKQITNDKKIQSEFFEKYLEIEQKHMLLELYLPDNSNKNTSINKEDEHRIIKDKISNILSDSILNFYINPDSETKSSYIHENIKRDIEYKLDENEEKKITIEILKKNKKELVNYVSQYLKKEWDRAKKKK
ncbi:hypothetical protein [Mammaliicoccus sciuri]|uniref:hypothetical protein n=1 Tax=Mammaliicoccus sciuri TaxID=1296 RepID=UPI00289F9BE0|nr:hypothetical protein [Mammaliicoccus sciuri]